MIDNKEIEQVLKSCKARIEKAKEDLAEAKAQKKILLNSLKKDFNLESFVEAEISIKKLNKELIKSELEIEVKYNELKERFQLC